MRVDIYFIFMQRLSTRVKKKGSQSKTILLLSPLGRVDFASLRAKDERGLATFQDYRVSPLLTLMTSIVLTSISFRQATFPKGESKDML